MVQGLPAALSRHGKVGRKHGPARLKRSAGRLERIAEKAGQTGAADVGEARVIVDCLLRANRV